MATFVTGATGFIGRHLVERLLQRRRGPIYVLTREVSVSRVELLRRTQWKGSSRVIPVVGELTAPRLGVSDEWLDEHRGEIRHMFHLAALYDMTAGRERNAALNVGGTAAAVDFAAEVRAGTFHHVSSVAVAGDHHGVFDETMFDVGQNLPSPYHETKFESERLVRETCPVPWRVYRPAIVVGHSESGLMDKIDGPYYFFPLLKTARTALPQWARFAGTDLGDTNIVPVDFVADALDHLAHVRGHDGETFHLVSPDPQPTLEVLNTFAAAAGAPQVSTVIDRSITRALPTRLRPVEVLTALARNPISQAVLDQTLGRLGIPAEVLGHLSLPATFASAQTQRALAGGGIECPPLDSYAGRLWDFWEQHLDPGITANAKYRAALAGTTVVITGASSGIGRATAIRVSKLGAQVILVARGKEKLLETQAEIELTGGTAWIYPCDLSDLDAIDDLTAQIVRDHPRVHFVVNNAGRSIRRSLRLSEDRFHDFERTMQLNYFGAIRLVMGLLPAMRAHGRGHVVNISSIGVQTHPPRFSAYVASKAALDAWSRVVSSELIGDGVTFTTIRMPLVRTPMISPTTLYDAFPAITPAQAADIVLRGLVDRPHEINTSLGTAGEIAHAVAPKAAFQILHLAYQTFPDSAAARGDADESPPTGVQMALSRILRGIHW